MTKDMRIQKGIEMKKNIISTSIKILAEEGIEGISAQKISTALNISKSNIFHHFKNVDNILEVIFETILNNMLEPIKGHNIETVEEFLEFIGKGIHNTTDEERIFYIVLFQLYTVSLYNKKYQEILLKQKNDITTVIAAELNNFTKASMDKCLKVSEMILMTLDGYGLSALLEENSTDYNSMWRLNIPLWISILNKEENND